MKYYNNLPIIEDENLLFTIINTLANTLWGSSDNYSTEYIDYMKKSQTKYTLAQGEMIYDLVQNASKVQRDSGDLMDIIDEELSTFFGGAKSAADTAKIIDSRARIYISENS